MKNITIRKMQTAEDFRDLHQMSTSFKVWRDYTVMKVIERKQNHHKAEAHYRRYCRNIIVSIMHIELYTTLYTSKIYCIRIGLIL